MRVRGSLLCDRAVSPYRSSGLLSYLNGSFVSSGDLVITADIPLAAAVLGKDAYVLDPRGIWFSRENIQERLTMREVLDQLRGSGVDTGGPAPYTPQDGKAFAGQLDRFLTRHAPPGPLA